MFTPYGDLPVSPAVAASKDASEEVAVDSGFYSPLADLVSNDVLDSDPEEDDELSVAVCDARNCDFPVFSAQHKYCSPACRVGSLSCSILMPPGPLTTNVWHWVVTAQHGIYCQSFLLSDMSRQGGHFWSC